jgi:hypothetical protein
MMITMITNAKTMLTPNRSYAWVVIAVATTINPNEANMNTPVNSAKARFHSGISTLEPPMMLLVAYTAIHRRKHAPGG